MYLLASYFYLTPISCIYLFRAGVSLNIHSFIYLTPHALYK